MYDNLCTRVPVSVLPATAQTLKEEKILFGNKSTRDYRDSRTPFRFQITPPPTRSGTRLQSLKPGCNSSSLRPGCNSRAYPSVEEGWLYVLEGEAGAGLHDTHNTQRKANTQQEPNALSIRNTEHTAHTQHTLRKHWTPRAHRKQDTARTTQGTQTTVSAHTPKRTQNPMR